MQHLSSIYTDELEPEKGLQRSQWTPAHGGDRVEEISHVLIQLKSQKFACLVGGLEHEFYFPYIGNVSMPIVCWYSHTHWTCPCVDDEGKMM